MNKVYIRWNPLHERVVCAHTSEELECKYCIQERDNIKNTAYSLEGGWFEIDSDKKLCYCGEPVDTSNIDCVEYNLCKEHGMDT